MIEDSDLPSQDLPVQKRRGGGMPIPQNLPRPRWREWTHVSGSQIASYDERVDPKTACARKWHIEKVMGVKPPKTVAQSGGVDKHTEFENWYKHGTPPTDPVLIAGFNLWPARSPSIEVEPWFSLEIPGWTDSRERKVLDTGWPMGYGRMTGRADLIDPGSDPPRVCDLKNLAAFSYAKKAHELAASPPMIAYAYYLLTKRATGATIVELQHIVNRTKGKPDARDVSVNVTRGEVEDRWGALVETVGAMRKLALVKDWRDVPPNRAACFGFGGCPYRGMCASAAREQEQVPEQDLDNGAVVQMKEPSKRQSLLMELDQARIANQIPDPVKVQTLREMQAALNALNGVADPNAVSGGYSSLDLVADQDLTERVIAFLAAHRARTAPAQPQATPVMVQVAPAFAQGETEALQQAEPTPAPAAAPPRMRLFLDCRPMTGFKGEVQEGILILVKYKDAVAQRAGVDHYRAIDFNKGPPLVAAAFMRDFRAGAVKVGALFLDSTDPAQMELAHALAPFADEAIRGVR